MSATVLQRPRNIAFQVPTGILVHHPRQAEAGNERVWPQETGTQRPTYLHPMAVIAAAAGYGWVLLVFWIIFAGDSYTSLVLFLATMISCAILGLMSLGGDAGRNVVPWQRPWHSFSEFLKGQVEVWGARMSGRDAFIQLVGMAWCLAGLATAFAIIIALSQP